jgi:hypothetical protein
MPLGNPAIPTLRADAKTGVIDVRSLNGVISAIAERLRQIEIALGHTSASTDVGLFSVLAAQDDGFVVKANGILVTRKFTVSEGLHIDNATGAKNPLISAPVLDDLVAQPDGFVVKTGTDAVTRVLIGGSGSGITIHNPDGAASDPDFTVP